MELSEVVTRVNELTVTITSLTGDKRRGESDFAGLQAELEEALLGRRSAEERADRAQLELNRLAEELRQSEENYRNADTIRKQLEVELRQVVVRLEQTEATALREGKRLVDKLTARLREVEAELEAEQRRSRDLAAENRKLLRLLQEQKQQTEEERRLAAEASEQINQLHIRIKTLKRQLDEAEEVVAITMNKYRKAHQLLLELEAGGAGVATGGVDKSRTVVTSGKGDRSMSVTREITRVVRV
jgi:myosin heavy chain 6/7